MSNSYTPITIKRLTTTQVQSVTSTPNNSRNFLNSADGAGGTLVDFTAKISPSGDFLKAIGFNVIINSIRNLLLTPLGSYPFDPAYGSLLFQKVFMPADNKTEEEIRFEVVNRTVQFDDRIAVTDVSTSFFNNKRGFRINVTLRRYGDEKSITVDFPEELYQSSNPNWANQ